MKEKIQPLAFDALYRIWIIERKKYVSEQTYAVYASYYGNHFKTFFGGKTSISSDDLSDFARLKIDSGFSRSSVQNMLIVLNSVMKYGKEKGYAWNCVPLKVRYTQEVKDLIRRKYSVVDAFSLEEQDKITQCVLNDFNSVGLGILFSLYAGLRIGEVCALKWGDIDIRRKLINVSHSVSRVSLFDDSMKSIGTKVVYGAPKTDSSVREIPLAPALFGMVKPFCLLFNSENFILSNSKHPCNSEFLRSRYRSLITSAGVRPLKFHCLRHTFATRCIESGCDIKTTSALLGHHSITTTLDTYVHPNEEQKRRVLQKMSKSLGFGNLLDKEKTIKLSL